MWSIRMGAISWFTAAGHNFDSAHDRSRQNCACGATIYSCIDSLFLTGVKKVWSLPNNAFVIFVDPCPEFARPEILFGRIPKCISSFHDVPDNESV
jgi:hypothetical protein